MGGPHRWVRALIVTAVCTIGIGLAPHASAARVDPVLVSEAAPYQQPRGPIAAQNPSGRVIAPGDCEVSPACHVMALQVEAPPVGPDEDYFARLTITWDTRRVGERPTNDLDVYVWNSPPGAAPIAQSTVNTPESLTLFRPDKPRYEVVVVNRLGPNAGYTVAATVTREALPRPFESVAPGATSGGRSSGRTAPSTAPPASSTAPMPTQLATQPSPPSPSGEVAPMLALPSLGAAQPDPQLFGPETAAAGVVDPSGDRPPAVPASAGGEPPAPVSPAAAIFWMVFAPAALVAGGAMWLRRRAPVALTA